MLPLSAYVAVSAVLFIIGLLGAMLFTEAWAKYMETAHLARPTIVLGIVMIVFGLFGGKFIAWKQARSNN